MAIEKPTQRRFEVMGSNTFRIANRLMTDQRLCRLLKYQTRNPFKEVDPITQKPQPDVDGSDLIHKQILIVPKVFDDSTTKMSYVIAVFDGFVVNQMNPEFKISTIRFDIACPYDEWVLNGQSLRPYLIMQEIDDLFNESAMAGIGTLQFHRADNLVLTPWIGGYSMWYKINEFN
jgi:hypothetical protein